MLGRLTLELSRFDLVELVRDVIRRLAPDAQRARCDVRLVIRPVVRPSVRRAAR